MPHSTGSPSCSSFPRDLAESLLSPRHWDGTSPFKGSSGLSAQHSPQQNTLESLKHCTNQRLGNEEAISLFWKKADVIFKTGKHASKTLWATGGENLQQTQSEQPTMVELPSSNSYIRLLDS